MEPRRPRTRSRRRRRALRAGCAAVRFFSQYRVTPTPGSVVEVAEPDIVVLAIPPPAAQRHHRWPRRSRSTSHRRTLQRHRQFHGSAQDDERVVAAHAAAVVHVAQSQVARPPTRWLPSTRTASRPYLVWCRRIRWLPAGNRRQSARSTLPVRTAYRRRRNPLRHPRRCPRTRRTRGRAAVAGAAAALVVKGTRVASSHARALSC